MASPTFVELQDSVLSRDYGATAARTLVKGWINDANRDVHASFRWSWAEATSTLTAVAGTETIAVPSTLLWPGRIRPADSLSPKLEWIDPGNINKESALSSFNPTATERGTPKYITMYGGSFYFDPTPISAFTWTLYFWKKAVVLTADADLPAIPEDDREVLVYGALYRAAERDRDFNASSYWRAEYDKKLMKMRERDTIFVQAPRKVSMPLSYHGRFDRNG